MKNRSKLITALVVLGLIVFGFVYSSSGDGAPDSATNEFVQIVDEPEPTSTDVIGDINSVSTFARLIEASNYDSLLDDKGPQFTIFIPNDSAFAALGEDAVNRLLLPENRSELSLMLSNHISPEFIRSGDFVNNQKVTTLGIAQHSVSVDNDTISIGGSSIVQSDIDTSNSVMHVIDRVLVQ